MSPALKSAFIGLMLLGLVVTQANATFDCSKLTSGVDAIIAPIINLDLFLILSGIIGVPSTCCTAIAKLKADIAADIALGVPLVTCCKCVKTYCVPPLILNINAILKLANLCAIVDLDAYLNIC